VARAEADHMAEIEVFDLDGAVAAGDRQSGHGLDGDHFFKGEGEAAGKGVGFRVKEETFHRLLGRGQPQIEFQTGQSATGRGWRR
jgi:hypothetical protein